MLNLFLALFWLILGLALLAWDWASPTGPRLTIPGTGISSGWFALVLALYNLARWEAARAAAREREATLRAIERRRAPEREWLTPPPDPNFNFSERPPPPPGERPDAPG